MRRITIISGMLVSFLLGVLLFDIGRDDRLWGVLLLWIPGFFWPRIAPRVWLLWWSAFALGMLRVLLALHIPGPQEVAFYAHAEKAEQNSAVIGTVANFPEEEFERIRVYLQVESLQVTLDAPSQPTSGKIAVNLPRYPEVRYGDRLRVIGALQIPPVWEDFSYQRFLEKEEIYAYIPRAQVEILGHEQGNAAFRFLFGLRLRIENILNSRLPEPEASFARGILLGGDSGFPQATVRAFQRTGLTHMLALSGFNITILILFVFWCLRFLPKWAKLIGTGVFLVGFVLLTGASASVLRAAVMGALSLLVLHSGREAHPGYVLLISMALIVLINPFLLYSDVSFQLSVAGVIGLLFCTPLWEKWTPYLPGALGIREALQTTLAAQVMSLPLIAFYFQRVSLIAPFANLLVAPLIPLAMLCSFLTLLPGIGSFFGFLAFGVLRLALGLTELLAQIPYADIAFGIGILWLFMIYALLGFLVWRNRSRLAIQPNPLAALAAKG